jgi:DNA polymerase-3 subunit epsilon
MSEKYSRQIVLDTETTGLNPKEGHRIIEIGCIELVNRRLTRNQFHVYINPQRIVDAGAIEVHGITNEFLQDKPVFADIAKDFFDFIQGAQLLIHNAPFDVGFINYEFSLLNNGFSSLEDYCNIFDTLAFARTKHPGQRNSLDALCKRYNIDNSHRELHGALLDAEILADVYLQMTGGQASLLAEENHLPTAATANQQKISLNRPPLKVIYCTETEQNEHQNRLAAIDKASKGQCLWTAMTNA